MPGMTDTRSPELVRIEQDVQAQIKDFFAKGGEVEQVPFGTMKLAPVAFKNSATRKVNDISYSKKDRIRMEDGL